MRSLSAPRQSISKALPSWIATITCEAPRYLPSIGRDLACMSVTGPALKCSLKEQVALVLAARHGGADSRSLIRHRNASPAVTTWISVIAAARFALPPRPELLPATPWRISNSDPPTAAAPRILFAEGDRSEYYAVAGTAGLYAPHVARASAALPPMRGEGQGLARCRAAARD